jgi:hypothetical protein
LKIVQPITISDTNLTSSNVAEADYALYNAGTTYALGDTIIVTTGVHKIYKSLINGNAGNYPPDNPDKWQDLGSTNRYKMFDTSIQSQTSNTTSIVVAIQTSSFVNCIALLNVLAGSVSISMNTSEGIVYNKTATLSSVEGITDAYTYCFSPIIRQTDIVFDDIPYYASATFTITITNTGSTASCGCCILGLSTEISSQNYGIEYGFKTGIDDYSIKTQDDFGGYTITERAFRNNADWTVYIEPTKMAYVQNLLAQRRAKPTLYIGSKDYTNTYIYGFFKSFSVELPTRAWSVCTVSLESLT